MTAKHLKLGLIGDNIAASQAPRLHALAGRQHGIDIQYDRLVPAELGRTFDEIFSAAPGDGYHALNVTYPYKELAAAKVQVDDPRARALGAVNTVVFGDGPPKGFNTDYTGFMAAYRHVRGEAPTGAVCMVGAGGVGKAVGFGLAALGTRDLRLVERDRPRAEALANALRAAEPDMAVSLHDSVAEAADTASGLINCTPVGMVGYGGTPFPKGTLDGGAWAFDAVYTPTDTEFLVDAQAAGLEIVSGYELFFFQGLHASKIFTGLDADAEALRRALADGA